jgi:TPR repeat protein
MLPLLQYALKETWALRKGNVMTGDSYARSGGVREAIRITAERTFDALSGKDQEAARQLFLRLVTPGEGQEDTRARAMMPVEPMQRKIVEQFAGPRTRLLVTGLDRAARPTVEVAHEALIRTWPRLRQWIDANREKLRARAAVLQSKADWEQSGKRDDMLLPAGLQLERARILLADPGDITIDDIKEFVSLSSAREETAQKQTADLQRKRVRNRNIALAVVSSLAVLAVLLGLLTYGSLKVATEQEKQANDILTSATKVFEKVSDQLDIDSRKEVFAVFQTGAVLGNSASMVHLGWAYSRGYGVAQDYGKSREWYEKAAGKGDEVAMRQLGRLYEKGLGVAQDYGKAREWFEKAADEGDMLAMNYLGWHYENGQGVAQDYIKAREWYEKAAGNGHAEAMNSLGVLYDNGQGVAQDYGKAREWYEKAADKGDAFAMNNIGVLYEKGQGVAQDYIKAREWYEKAAGNGHAGAMNSLGVLYEKGQGVAQNYVKAREWYEKAADKGEMFAMNSIGVLYENGYGVAQDYGKAREWYEKAADKGDMFAMNNIGVLYEKGQGVAQDYIKAREWYEKAAGKGDATAKAYLKQLPIEAAAAAKRFVEALQLQEALAAEEEAAETKREGKPGEDTALALHKVAWRALFAREPGRALTAAERAHELLPENLGIETSRAHALMFLGRQKEAEALYLAYKGQRVSDDTGWERVIANDFAEFRNAGLTHPMMTDIEKDLDVSR